MNFNFQLEIIILSSLIFLTQSTPYGISKDDEFGTDVYSPTTVTTKNLKLNEFSGEFRSGQLIFEENFDEFDFSKWRHENTLAGGGNWEFQWYTNNRSNSFVKNGNLHIRPTLTADVIGEDRLSSATVNVDSGYPAGACTNSKDFGCQRTANETFIINPIRSAAISTFNSFSVKYAKIEVRAKLPIGDWLWPAIWMLPKEDYYGPWPASGEIDILEARGNKNLFKNGVNIGAEQITSALHFAPFRGANTFKTSFFTKNIENEPRYTDDFHRYQMEWGPENITFKVDDEEIGCVNVGNGFWARGSFNSYGKSLDNPWQYGERNAPFDREFYLIINLAVGGINFFSDDVENPGGKPFPDQSPNAAKDFWNGRNLWIPTWQDPLLLVDYVRIYAY